MQRPASAVDRPGFFLCDSGFARATVRERLPSIVNRLLSEMAEERRESEAGGKTHDVEAERKKDETRAGLEALRESLKSDAAIPSCPDHGLRLQWGQPWSALPFLHAEVRRCVLCAALVFAVSSLPL